MSDERSHQITLLPVTEENTRFFIEQRCYTKLDCQNLVLAKGKYRIHGTNGRYEFSEVDEFERRLWVQTIAEGLV